MEKLNNTEMKLWLEFVDDLMNKQPKWTEIAFAVSMYTIFVVSLVGNLLTCIVIYYDKTMHTATNYYLFNLAVSDLIVSFGIFIDVNEHIFYSNNYVQYDQFGNLACKIHFFFIVALWYNGILILTALAIERYIAICYPMMLQSKPVWRRVGKIIALIWMIAIIEALPELWVVELITTRRSSVCFTLPTKAAKIINGVTAVLTFIIPLAIMIFVYGAVACEVNINQKNSCRDKIFNHRDNRSKVNKLIVALTMSFLVCWLPFFFMRLMFVFEIKQIMKLKSWWRIGYNLTAFSSWFSTVLNPILFSLMSIKFRKALKTLWNTKFRRQRQHMQSSII